MNDFHILGRGPRPLAPPSGEGAGEESVDFCLFYFCILYFLEAASSSSLLFPCIFLSTHDVSHVIIATHHAFTACRFCRVASGRSSL